MKDVPKAGTYAILKGQKEKQAMGSPFLHGARALLRALFLLHCNLFVGSLFLPSILVSLLIKYIYKCYNKIKNSNENLFRISYVIHVEYEFI